MKYIIFVLVLILEHINDKVASDSCGRRLVDWERKKNSSNETFPLQMNLFTFNLLRTLVENRNENVLFYPLNIVKHLFIMFWGSDKCVARQIEAALDLYLGTTECHKELHNYFYDWSSSEKTIVYEDTDRIFLNVSVSLLKSYKRHVKMYYPNVIKRVNFTKIVDDKLLDFGFKCQTITKDMLLVLLSVVNMEINLNLQSTSNITSDAAFATTLLNYRKDEDTNCQLVELPVHNGPISLLLVIPSLDIKAFMEVIGIDTLRSWITFESFKKTQVTLQKVDLDLRCFLNLESILPHLGITGLFRRHGGLSKISRRKHLLVNKFIQRSFLEIKTGSFNQSEEPTDFDSRIVIKTNAHYLFFIVDKDKKMIISAGSVIEQ